MTEPTTTAPSPPPTCHDTPNPDVQARDRDRDSAIFLSDNEDLPSLPSSTIPKPTATTNTSSPHLTDSSISPTLINSTISPTHRLNRPADLNLSQTKPKSELQQRFDLIRNSSSQNRASLKSPTQLMRDRLNLSPKKTKMEVERVFVAPREKVGGCLLPAPGGPPCSSRENAGDRDSQGGIPMSVPRFTANDICARTSIHNRPAWWCKFDKLVIFDGIHHTPSGNQKFQTRSSKGLSIARRRGDLETVVIPLDCMHCQDMLRRSEWKYDVRVCKRSVCWNCRERCRWEEERGFEEQTMEGKVGGGGDGKVWKSEISRERADSVLQDPEAREEELCRKVGIDVMPLSPIEIVGGIEERLRVMV